MDKLPFSPYWSVVHLTCSALERLGQTNKRDKPPKDLTDRLDVSNGSLLSRIISDYMQGYHKTWSERVCIRGLGLLLARWSSPKCREKKFFPGMNLNITSHTLIKMHLSQCLLAVLLLPQTKTATTLLTRTTTTNNNKKKKTENYYYYYYNYYFYYYYYYIHSNSNINA